LIVPLALRKAPYCASCQLYMKSRQLGLVAASVPLRKVKKSDEAGKAAYETEQQQSMDNGKQTVAALEQLAAANNTADFQKKIDELAPGKKAAAKLPIRFNVQLTHCKRCCGGQLITRTMTGQGKQLRQTDYSRADLHPEFVRSVVPQKS